MNSSPLTMMTTVMEITPTTTTNANYSEVTVATHFFDDELKNGGRPKEQVVGSEVVNGIVNNHNNNNESRDDNDDNDDGGGPLFSSNDSPPILMNQWPIPSSHTTTTTTATTVIQGIPNYGQTCFLNSILQSLASLTAFELYLQSQILASSSQQQHYHYYNNNKKKESLFLTRQLWHGVQHLNGRKLAKQQQHQPWDPRLLLTTIAESHEQFRSLYQQQDAQELLGALLDVLVKEQEQQQQQQVVAAQQQQQSQQRPRIGNPSMAFNPPKIWALSPSFLRLYHRAALSIEDYPHNEYCYNNDLDIDDDDDDDDDILSVASSARERAQQVQKEKHEASIYASNENPSKEINGNHSTTSTKLSSDSSSPEQIGPILCILAGEEEKKNEEFEVRIVPQQHSSSSPTKLSNQLVDRSIHDMKQPQEPTSEKVRNNDPNHSLHDKNGVASDVTGSPPSSSASLILPSSQSYSEMSVSTPASYQSWSSSQQHRRTRKIRTTERLAMPLTGWMGSTLQCATCHYVRPIQNTPFIDLSIVPTAVSARSIGDFYYSTTSALRHTKNNIPSSPSPSCTVEECLSEFTRLERVEQVDCPSCTKLHHWHKIQEEVEFWEYTLKDATAVLQKKKQQSTLGEILTATSHGELQSIQEELDRNKEILRQLEQINCEEDDFGQRMALLLGMPSDDSDESEEEEEREIPFIRQDANKCLFLTRLPPVFCLHVQRRFYDPQTSRLDKTTQTVLFEEFLNVAPYCAYTTTTTSKTGSSNNNNPNQNGHAAAAPSWIAGTTTTTKATTTTTTTTPEHCCQIFYRLKAVLEHRGGANCGHYVCYRRASSSNTDGWYYISDDVVRRVSWNTVQQCQAYMLFYENCQIANG